VWGNFDRRMKAKAAGDAEVADAGDGEGGLFAAAGVAAE